MKDWFFTMIVFLKSQFLMWFENKPLLLTSIVVIFFVSIPVFAKFYHLVDDFARFGTNVYKGHRNTGFVQPGYAFHLAESYKDRLELDIIRDLRIRKLYNSLAFQSWGSFAWREEKTGNQMVDTEFDLGHELLLRGLSISELVEEKFKKYGGIPVKIVGDFEFKKHQYAQQQICSKFFGIRAQDILFEINRNPRKEELIRCLNFVGNKIKELLKGLEFRKGNIRLGMLGELLEGISTIKKGMPELENIDRLKELFYTYLISDLFTGYKYRSELFIRELSPRPKFLDFVYFSLVISTVNIPSDIYPVTTFSKVLMWFQLIFSFSLATLLIAGFSALIFRV